MPALTQLLKTYVHPVLGSSAGCLSALMGNEHPRWVSAFFHTTARVPDSGL